MWVGDLDAAARRPQHGAVASLLTRRPLDLVLVVFFALSALYGFAFSIPEGLEMAPISADSPYPPFRALHGWAAEVEPAHLDPPPSMVARSLLDGFVHSPFLLVLVYALIRGRRWIRIPALLYAASAVTNMLLYFHETFWGPHPPLDYAVYIPFNLPWLIAPLLLAYRMRRVDPFA